MISLIQRVSTASVIVDDETIASIGAGLLALVAVEPDDGHAQTERMLHKLLGYRVFADHEGRMNRSLADTEGSLLLVPQFTLAAETSKGMRPGFSSAASPEVAREGFNALVNLARATYPKLATGRFGANMQVSLTNDGPVTFWLRVR